MLGAGRDPDLRAGPGRAGPAQPPRRPPALHHRPGRRRRRGRARLHRRRHAAGRRRRGRPERHLGRRPTRSPGTSTAQDRSSSRAPCRSAPTPSSARRMAEVTDVAVRRRQQPRVPQGRGGDRRLHEARPRRRRRPPSRRSASVLRELYAPFLRTEQPFLVMSPESAEMTKYVANAMLATKISFINEMANLCERLRRRHQRRPPRHRPRLSGSASVPLPRRRLRRQLLPQGRPRADRTWPGSVGVAAADDARRSTTSTRRQKHGPGRTRSSTTSAATWRARRSPSGAWRSSRGPTTSARPRPWS